MGSKHQARRGHQPEKEIRHSDKAMMELGVRLFFTGLGRKAQRQKSNPTIDSRLALS